ncbi:hypothetical protein JXA47_02555 [Candidatus Sumerlaeota bacterium]|nr:hypothetical protein [Candidatus Sumerlaeota bacterium]
MMRLALLLSLALGVAALPAQELTGPEPGVFLYRYNEGSSAYERNYYPTQQEAMNVLAPDHARALAAAQDLNAQLQGTLTENTLITTAQWMIFCEQWHMWQGWIMQEYGDVYAKWPGGGGARFAAVPGTPLRWEAAPEPEPGTQTGTADYARAGGGREEGPGGDPFGEMGGQMATAQQVEEEEPVEEAAITLANFAPMPVEQQQLSIDVLGQVITEIVQETAEEKYQVLTAILDDLEENTEMRERREAYVAARQRDITDLREIILSRQAAEELVIDDTLYLFSPQPLERLPDNTVNIPTPNLTPYDIFDDQGSVRSTTR